jgi:hypothetical protein
VADTNLFADHMSQGDDASQAGVITLLLSFKPTAPRYKLIFRNLEMS